MKHNPTLRALFVLFISVIFLTSCEKAEELTGKGICTTEFTGESTSCSSSRQAIYRFTYEYDENIKIQGDLINFTGADAVVSVTGASLNVTQLPAANSSNRTIKLEGPVLACQEVTITITWNSNYPGGIVTGVWSVKNASGTDLAAPVPMMQCGEERSVRY